MFPMEFDSRILSTLPLPNEDRIKTVAHFLQAVIARRIVPYFKSKRGTDPLKLGRLSESLSIVRLEDESNLIRTVSFITPHDNRWILRVHERIFDYLSFVIPSDPESQLRDGSREELKMLAFMEFFLRHEIEHLLYPERTERDVVQADAFFALDRRNSDPTFYRMLRHALSDEMNGLRGEHFLAMLDEAERGLPMDSAITNILNALSLSLADAPIGFLNEVFSGLDTEIQSRILGEVYRRSRDTSRSLLKRTGALRLFLRLFAMLGKKSEQEAGEVFRAFVDRWGVVDLFKELDLPEAAVDTKSTEELLHRFIASVNAHLEEEEEGFKETVPPRAPVAPAQPRRSEEGEKSLKDRIEEARSNLAVPRQVMEVIDKNRLNAIGHSGSKYSELIETLLAIPWGRIRSIQVSPEDFEEGLERSHFGLRVPKEIICDFFTNLIWRYQDFSADEAASWRGTGSAFLLVGPPGVGKTSFAISVAQNLGIPYHKISLGGMRDEADMRGHGFTYEGSKPGAIVQGLIKMQVMNGLFILDEADKTEKFAVATLLEILDPEQNHLFHDKYTQTTVDIDLSNCHFFLTANTLEGVPPVVVNRCEVIVLDQYSVEEKVSIARRHLMARLRDKYRIPEGEIFFDPEEEMDLFRYLIRTYTFEAGVRELERVIRTLFLRIQRRKIRDRQEGAVTITREMIKGTLKEPIRPRQVNPDDAIGEMLGVGVDLERGVGSVIPIQASHMGAVSTESGRQKGFLSVVHATGNIERVMDESRKVATTGIFSCADEMGIPYQRADEPIHLHFMGGSTRKDGPSAGGAIALALASLLAGRKIRRDVAMTGEIDTKGRITGIGALALKIETSCNSGCRTLIIPTENLTGAEGIERLPAALKEELQVLTYDEWKDPHKPFDWSRHILEVVAVDDIVQASHIAIIDDAELDNLTTSFESHAVETARNLASMHDSTVLCTQVIQVKTPEEINVKSLESLLRDQPCQLTFLALPEILSSLTGRLARFGDQLSIVGFDYREKKLSIVLREIMDCLRAAGRQDVRLALIAPFYLIRRDGIKLGDFPRNPPLEGFRIFANNFAADGVKIKKTKTLLNHVYSILNRLDTAHLNACPFLMEQDGIHMVDLTFIPEKYRLDLQRAEKILNRTLTHWLDTLQRHLGGGIGGIRQSAT